MCGYSGFIHTKASTVAKYPNLREDFIQAALCLEHRGNEPLRSILLPNILAAHTRLAFQDLSPQSAQPMWSADQKWLLIFNGEIYNYKYLRTKIQNEFNYPFQSQGDSEVILAGFLCYQEKILELLDGEYSFAIFKADGSEVFAARDPFGVKPLFVWCEGVDTKQFAIANSHYKFDVPSLCFSSEMKGIFAKKTWDNEGFLRQAVGLYEPIRTPLKNLIQVPQGSYLWAKKNYEQNMFCAQLVLDAKPIRNTPFQSYQNSNQIYHDFNTLLEESVSERTVSDVELGVYLSGGIDSKTIAAYLGRGRKSFTVGFDVEDGFDESKDALDFAHAAGLDPFVCRINYVDLAYAYPIAVYHSENIQPYTNGAAKWWLSLFASLHVKGVLTGDGADELFCGYPSFRYAAWWKFSLNNRKGKNVFDKLKNHPLGSSWRDSVYQKKFEEHAKNPWLSGSSHEGTGIDFIESLNMWGVAHPLFGQIKTTAELLLGVEQAHIWLVAQRESVASWFKFGFSENDEFYTDPQNTLFLWQNYFCKTHLPVQVLNWVGDRMEMANTLEGRTPFLSHKLKKFVHHLGDNFFVRGFKEKSILKRNFKTQFPQYSKFIPMQKKQFNAPLLFSLNAKFHSERILEKIKHSSLLDTEVLQKLLSPRGMIVESRAKNSQQYTESYREAALQTLVSFTYVDDCLIENKKLERDLNYENRVLVNLKNS